MKKMLLISLLIISNILMADEGWQVDTFDDVMTLETKIDGDRVVFKMRAETLGWISIGFEPSKVMKDADIFIGYIKGDEVVLEDHFATGFTSHKEDTTLGGTYDIEIIDGFEDGEITTIVFSVPLNSQDKFDNPLEEGKTYKLIYAIGKKDNLRTFHFDRGIGELTIPVKSVE